jgi:nicotinamidase-related amidase
MIDTKAFLSEARTALVIIDLQRGIASREVAPHSGAQVVENAAKLVEAFRAARLPVVFVRVAFSAGDGDALRPLLDNPPPMPPRAPDFSELMPQLRAQPDDIVVTKRNWGAFYGTDLELQLRRRDVQRIAICGISTNVGVESTARDAFERRYKLLFVEDAMAAMSAQEHEHSCRVMFPRMGIVRSTAQVLEALS